MTASNMSGADLIAAERQRQMDAEGWTPEHDDEHDCGELLDAACSYLTAGKGMWGSDSSAPWTWPWNASWWKPSDDPIRNLVKAGALIAAEIDRLQRSTRSSGVAQAGPGGAVEAERRQDQAEPCNSAPLTNKWEAALDDGVARLTPDLNDQASTPEPEAIWPPASSESGSKPTTQKGVD